MNREEILNVIRSLAQSQGFYGTILENITEEGLEFLVEQELKDPVDLVLFLEN